MNKKMYLKWKEGMRMKIIYKAISVVGAIVFLMAALGAGNGVSLMYTIPGAIFGILISELGISHSRRIEQEEHRKARRIHTDSAAYSRFVRKQKKNEVKE